MSFARKRLGLMGERETARRLASLGWNMLEHGWRGGGGEIDLSGLDAGPSVVVEVKTRS